MAQVCRFPAYVPLPLLPVPLYRNRRRDGSSRFQSVSGHYGTRLV